MKEAFFRVKQKLVFSIMKNQTFQEDHLLFACMLKTVTFLTIFSANKMLCMMQD